MNFNTIGIICEYNPFHFGHMYHIAQAKRMSGADSAVCIMSGSMVQRGEPAIFDKWSRAKAAIDGGADLVIELPAYYALQSADNFAYGAVYVLSSLGVIDALCFGAETDDIALLESAASLIANPTAEYNDALTQKLASGVGYPAASEYAMRKCLPDADDSLFSPNNILGMCYIAAIKKIASSITPFCIKRANDYHSHHSDDKFKSATAIRDMIARGDDYCLFAPDYSALCTYRLSNAESYILGFLRSCSPESLSDVKGGEDGLANLVINSAKKACTLPQFFDMCTTKRYTLHRIRRFCACAILGIHGDLSPDYVRILGFNSKGAALLRSIKQTSSLNLVTKAADYKGSPMFDIDVAATDFAALCCDAIQERFCGKDFLTSPYVAVGELSELS